MTPLKKLLLGTTSLSIWNVAPRDPITVGSAILSAFAIETTSVALIYAIGYLATTAVTSWALKALYPKPSAASMSSQGLLANAKDAAAAHEYVYGTVRKGGVITYLESTGPSNKFLHVILTLAGHEVNAIGDIYIDDQVATLDGSGFVTSQSWASKIRIVKYTGSQTTAPALLLAESAKINSTFIGNGIAYLYIRLEYDQDVFPSGIPLFTAIVQGKKVYDTRTSTTAFSANAALCIRDYITDARGLGDTSVNDTTFSASANVCDENVTLAVGGTEKRYTMNGVISADQTPGDILQQMMTCCAGTTFWGQGEWQLKVGYYTPPVKTLTLDDLRGPIQLQTRQSMGSIFNSVTGTFNDASQGYITVDYPKLVSSAFLVEDNSIDSPIDLPLPFTTSAASAQRISKLTLFRGREQMTMTADFGMAGFQVQVGDIVAFTNSRYGWTAKEFEVVGWRFFADQDAGDLRVNLELRETSSAAFDWAANESAIIANNTTLPSAFAAQTVGLSLVSINRVFREKVTSLIQITTSVSNENFVDRVEVEGKLTSEGTFKPIGSGPVGIYEWVDLTSDYYDIRARSISQLGVQSAWTTQTNFQVAGISTVPDDVSNFAANLNGGTISLDWTALANLDLSYYLIRHAIEEAGASFGNATTAVPKVSRPATSVAVPTRPGTYMIKAYDKTGNGSSGYASVVVPAAALETFATNPTDVESPTFPGTKTGCSVTSSELKIISTSFATTAASGSGTVATLTFATQASAPFTVGSSITISGVTPVGYNGTFVVTACTTTSVSYASTTTGAQTIAGTVFLTPATVTTAASGNGTTATLTFATQKTIPFAVGTSITVSGITPSGYNGTFVVTACTTSSVSYASTTTGSQTVAGAVFLSTAVYEFTGYIDTLAVRRVRSRIDINVTRSSQDSTNWDTMFASSVFWDSWPGLWDDWSGSSGIADTDVISYIAITQTDPAASPVWSDWQRFKAGDFYGRAFKFKVELASTSAGVSPSISGLTARVQY